MPSEEDIPTPSKIKKRKATLFVIAFMLLFFLFSLPRNWRWLEERIFPYASEFSYQWYHPEIEQRKKDRWRNSYLLSKQIDSIFEQKGIKEKVLVLLPPKGYFKERGITYHVPEPAVFYYYTGLKTTWVTSDLATKANWYVRVEQQYLVVEPVRSKKALLDTIAAFQKFSVEL
jgi:hypothetical protein